MPQPVSPPSTSCFAPLRPGPAPFTEAGFINRLSKKLRALESAPLPRAASPDGVGKLVEEADINPFLDAEEAENVAPDA